MEFSAIIPTYKREVELPKCLNSIVEQQELPAEVVLIDDDQISENNLSKYRQLLNKSGVGLNYHKKDHSKETKGSSASRNIGISLAKSEIVFILDDDLILEPDFFKNIMDVWRDKKQENLLGVGGIITNNRKKSPMEKFYNRIFGLTAEFKWDINNACFQSWDDDITNQEKGFYVHGGVCSYDKNKAEELGFTVFSGGREALEDVDFCLRAKNRNYFFIIEPKAKVFHDHQSAGKEDKFLSAQKESRNRKMIFKKNCPQSLGNRIHFIWSNTGWILRQFLSGNFKKGLGLTRGFFKNL
jgi:GT2 family glycosyltransferase